MSYEYQLYQEHIARMERFRIAAMNPIPKVKQWVFRTEDAMPIVEEVAEPEIVAPVAPVVLPPPVAKYALIKKIIQAVALKYGIPADEICFGGRLSRVVRARHIAMYLVRDIVKTSFPETGRKFGGRDHTTAMHAIGKIEKRWMEFEAEITELKELIAGGS